MTVVTINGTPSTHAELDTQSIRNIMRPIHPGMNNRFMPIPGSDGVVDAGGDRKEAYISFEVIIKSESYEARRDAARAWGALLNFSEAKEVIFGDESDKYYLARPTNPVNIDEVALTGTFTVTFVVPDGFAWATTETTTSAATPVTVTNAGTANTPVEVTVDLSAAVDPLRILHEESGDSITLKKDATRWDVDLVSGDEIVVDTGVDERSVLVNGESAQAGVTIDSRYFNLLPGANAIKLEELQEYLYEGEPLTTAIEHVEWDDGYRVLGSASLTKESNYLKIEVVNDEVVVYFYTVPWIDLTFVDEIFVDWEVTMSGSIDNWFVAQQPDLVWAASIKCTQSTRGVQSVNTEKLKGLHRIFLLTNSWEDADTDFRIYNVYLDRKQIPVDFTSATIATKHRARWA